MRREDLATALRYLAPHIPEFEFEAVIDHAMMSPTLSRSVPETALWLSLTAYIRHNFTDYDALLDDNYDVESARHFVLDAMNDKLAEWGVKRRISDKE
ncbi:hypothetical protein IZ6_01350 [Terrihabitans soli]|uniref:DUF2293 domain-containing protein n=1 Tax=Terrihabitans soli TaxID=708113 RepID=A0A6S6QR93_9HYPH|nr:DUF2293 domain-containing protein [Terrihabitans soli]BCJ89400.1 hypothetical protein IZ6_01350 [Terrihabitans soli]